MKSGPAKPKITLTKKSSILVAEARKLQSQQPMQEILPESAMSSVKKISASTKVETDGHVAGERIGATKWKRDRNKFSSLLKLTGTQKKTFKQRMEIKAEHQAMKKEEQAFKALLQEERDQERAKAQQRKKQKEENEKKGSITQTIKNSSKLKHASKKLLRQLIKV